jgi:hypothetical protein
MSSFPPPPPPPKETVLSAVLDVLFPPLLAPRPTVQPPPRSDTEAVTQLMREQRVAFMANTARDVVEDRSLADFWDRNLYDLYRMTRVFGYGMGWPGSPRRMVRHG